MRFASLGSGSAGNALLIEASTSTLMLDCGFSVREVTLRLERLGLSPEAISGIVLTHEHDDHARGAFKFAAKYQIPIWLSYGTLKMCDRYMPSTHALQLNVIDSHQPFSIKGIQIQPFPVPHDAREPIQYTFSDGQYKLGVLTDLGRSTPHIEMQLQDCHALVLECNHDADLLKTGPYSWMLKKRVGGDWGHLENSMSALLLAKLNHQRLQHVVAAHLSTKNNTPELVQKALSAVLACDEKQIGIADQDLGFDWLAIK